MERFMANIPPAKLAALNLSGTVYPYTSFFLHDLRAFFLFEWMYVAFKMLDVSDKNA